MLSRLVRNSLIAALAATALTSPAAAQDQAADMAAKIARLEAQIAALQQSVEALKADAGKAAPAPAAAPATAISWNGAPRFADEDKGWSFKPRGRLMYDVGNVAAPDSIDNRGLGFSSTLRRARLGVEGTIPGGFGYRFELDAATGEAEVIDAYLTYKTGPLEFTLGQHNNFQSLDELTSSLHSSFIERAAFTDAFGFERRVGASVQYGKGPLLLQAGAFTDNVSDLNEVGDDNNSYGFDARAVVMPKVGKAQLHFGGSAHWRALKDAADSVRYRQRAATQTSDVRFLDTGTIAGTKSELGYGLEAAAILGSFHLAGESYWHKVGREQGLAEPSFFGAYVEGGYFLTGETRGYKAGRFDRVKVRKPVGGGGFGALSLNGRWDFLDLADGLIAGGRQNAFQASLNWKPNDFILFGLNYAHILYDDAALKAGEDGDYSVDVIGLRSQIDF